MVDKKSLFNYLLRLGDDQQILSQRLGEWCGHAPTLEEDLALANIALDLLGQARSLYTYAGEVEGLGRDEDQLAFLRYENDYVNALIVERPNGDFAHTITRQFFYSVFMDLLWNGLLKSSDETIRAIAAKAVKEVDYHVRHSAEWVIRLGQGTAESRERMVDALDEFAIYTGELFEMDALATEMAEAGVGVDLAALRPQWEAEVNNILTDAGLEMPKVNWMQTGGRSGEHTEHLGHILAELQYMQRTYPGMTW
ncbi:phenylacetate-CoA oxygenase subunit PaaC [Pseudovibrio exalbescens]|uniref:1,2-phenylacetyl-CoA epoxidase subunit PaaC n=1 Tax=Pseudovibrio exalbescens TaxID=197461 RepID=UPI0023669502|nr:1,2-phenylacetyl-CoA epoxidase subunit PaaC [Pseudovibrio exalbescens]MDD7910752.1 phenylacetate-CoA oxygenase subunit PaaC [Pseudovibrio exalbescens]